jgi:hypothetical protein
VCWLPAADGARYHLAEWALPIAVDVLRATGCQLYVLPAYSPELNPIELKISKLRSGMGEVCFGT